MISFTEKGNFNNLERLLKRDRQTIIRNALNRYAREGIAALASVTPIDSGETANSWSYEIKIGVNTSSITFTNSNIVDGFPVAVMLQYGHASKGGYFVEGRDYINPAIAPIFDRIAESVWKEVSK